MTYFEELVKRMRTAQNNYFRAERGAPEKLNLMIKCAELERQVDRWIKDQERDDAGEQEAMEL
jgi:hypothetical protein